MAMNSWLLKVAYSTYVWIAGMRSIFMVSGTRFAMALIAILISPISFLACAQDRSAHYEVGIVYYSVDDGFKALSKEVSEQGRAIEKGVSVQSRRGDYVGIVKGAHATTRLRVGQPSVFLVCNVDPTRFKLYRFISDGKERLVIIGKTNSWRGGFSVVLQDSEVALSIKPVAGACFTLTPQNNLEAGEFGFSPAGTNDAFMFGVGDLK